MEILRIICRKTEVIIHFRDSSAILSSSSFAFTVTLYFVRRLCLSINSMEVKIRERAYR